MPENQAPYADATIKHAAQTNYRDALFRLKDATDEDLVSAADLAEATGDMVLLRAVGAIEDMRGDLNTTYRYLMRAGGSVQEKFTARNMLPTESTIGALIGAYEPPLLHRGELAPNRYVLEQRKRKEQQKSVRRSQLFRR